MIVTVDEYGYLSQLARGQADPLPLYADRVPQGYRVGADWAQRQVADWRAQHDPLCACWKAQRAR